MLVIDQVNPHLTLVSNRADEGLVEGIKKKRKWSDHLLPSSTLHLTLILAKYHKLREASLQP